MISAQKREVTVPSPTPEEAEWTATAVRRSFLVEQTERKRRSSQALGFAQINYGRLFVRDRWTLFAIARELGCTVEDLLEPPQPSRESCVAWSEVVVWSEAIMSAVRSLSEELREVTVLRASGLGWRRIGRLRPDRLAFSLADDFADAIDRVWRVADRECRAMAFADHPKFIVVKTRS